MENGENAENAIRTHNNSSLGGFMAGKNKGSAIGIFFGGFISAFGVLFLLVGVSLFGSNFFNSFIQMVISGILTTALGLLVTIVFYRGKR